MKSEMSLHRRAWLGRGMLSGGGVGAANSAVRKPSHRDLPFENMLREGVAVATEIVRDATGTDLSDFKPANLRVIDRLFGPPFSDRVKQDAKTYSTSVVAFGSYLGEVMIRNLGGEWHFPNFFQLIVASISWSHFTTSRYMYVVLGKKEARVFRAARLAIDKTSKAFSLYEFYELYARGDGSSQIR